MKQMMPRKIFVHCIGHSLGAHICGFTGKLIRKKIRKEKEGGYMQTFDSVLDRISGLDPAGPMFFNDNPEYKYPVKIESGGRLAHTDAQVINNFFEPSMICLCSKNTTERLFCFLLQRLFLFCMFFVLFLTGNSL